ncbi:unnamed protein product [Clavelina lepadiformis]|uniref:Secreted protein n=1 Tax=Clavelina lepadiformis TaxID=159417 RepID=A0ABP0FNL5_CLALP
MCVGLMRSLFLWLQLLCLLFFVLYLLDTIDQLLVPLKPVIDETPVDEVMKWQMNCPYTSYKDHLPRKYEHQVCYSSKQRTYIPFTTMREYCDVVPSKKKRRNIY